MNLALSEPLRSCLWQRRRQLSEQISAPVLLWSGTRPARNYPDLTYPFRASSHFLYFSGLPIESAVIRLDSGRLDLFWDEPPASHVLWTGPTPTRDQIAAAICADAAYPLSEVPHHSQGAATLPVQDPRTRARQSQVLGRELAPDLHGKTLHPPSCDLSTPPAEENRYALDRALAQAIVKLRLTHDPGALHQIREAAAVTIQAHQAGMRSTPQARWEYQVRAAMEQVIIAAGMTCAYTPIVTVHGEVLHNEVYDHALQPGDLVLADVGAEHPLGWASDVTRTWPVSGRFSPTQRDLYDVVLAAHDACIDRAAPGVEYRDLHLLAAVVIMTGLVDLGICTGSPQDLVERDAHALFFPHGIGHLLGLDVHDMEDLGDLAGYASGRGRSTRWGLKYLRLDRPLQPGMVVTIEPGIYQLSAVLQDPDRYQPYQDCVNWERLQAFQDVRGIRIEDDVLITDAGHEVITQALPTQATQIEAWVQPE